MSLGSSALGAAPDVSSKVCEGNLQTVGVFSRDQFVENALSCYLRGSAFFQAREIKFDFCKDWQLYTRLKYRARLLDAANDLATVTTQPLNWLSEIPTLVLLDEDSVEDQAEFLLHGARGVWLFSDSLHSLADALNLILNGGLVIPPSAGDLVLERVGLSSRDGGLCDRGNSKAESVVDNLTQTELRVAKRLCAGFTNRQIASQTQVSESTVKFHVRNICEKIGALSRANAAAILVSGGIGIFDPEGRY